MKHSNTRTDDEKFLERVRTKILTMVMTMTKKIKTILMSLLMIGSLSGCSNTEISLDDYTIGVADTNILTRLYVEYNLGKDIIDLKLDSNTTLKTTSTACNITYDPITQRVTSGDTHTYTHTCEVNEFKDSDTTIMYTVASRKPRYSDNDVTVTGTQLTKIDIYKVLDDNDIELLTYVTSIGDFDTITAEHCKNSFFIY